MLDLEISIIGHKSRHRLETCLDSLEAACGNLQSHITVVDNASADGTLELLAEKYPHITVIANSKRVGFGENHNKVLRRVCEERSSHYVLILNDDVRLYPGCVDTMVRQMDESPAFGALVPVIEDGEGRIGSSRMPFPTVRNALHADLHFGEAALITPWNRHGPLTVYPDDADGYLEGCCLLVRTDALKQVGLFDEAFFLFYEDVDLCKRLVDHGWELGVCRGARIVHRRHAATFRSSLTAEMYLQLWQSRYRYLMKHALAHHVYAESLIGRVRFMVYGMRLMRQGQRTSDPLHRWSGRLFVRLALLNPWQPNILAGRT